jgi:hypothetical protein
MRVKQLSGLLLIALASLTGLSAQQVTRDIPYAMAHNRQVPGALKR